METKRPQKLSALGLTAPKKNFSERPQKLSARKIVECSYKRQNLFERVLERVILSQRNENNFQLRFCSLDLLVLFYQEKSTRTNKFHLWITLLITFRPSLNFMRLYFKLL
jgi:hypothetical protein